MKTFHIFHNESLHCGADRTAGYFEKVKLIVTLHDVGCI